MATPRYRLHALLLSVGMTAMSLMATAADLVVSSIESIRDAVLRLVQPTAEYTLKEINATGHAAKTTSSNVVAIPQRRSRNSAARHVSMLTAKQGIALAA